MNKVKGIVTHKASLWSGGLFTAFLTAYTGYQQVGAPLGEKLVGHVVEVKNLQNLHIDGMTELGDKIEELIILQEVEILLTKDPRADVDSLIKHITFERYWSDR